MLLCMRTTVRLDPDLLRDAKRLAASTGRSLTAVIEDALREAILRRRSTALAREVKIPTFSGRGLRPGVDLDNSGALLDLMNQPE